MKNFAILLLAITFLFGCKKDKENNASGDYTKGLFVVNQGKFQSGTGTITYVSEKDSITDLFTQQNAGHILGNIAQSMIKFGDYYLVAINNGSKVQVLNAKDFTHKGEINGILFRDILSAVGINYSFQAGVMISSREASRGWILQH